VNLDVQIAHGVEEIGQEAWDHLSGNRPFASYAWYRFGEQAAAYDMPIYVIVSYQREPVARATFWLTSRELLPIPSKLVRYVLEAMLRRWPLLICQSPLSSAAATSGLILPDPPLRDMALQTIADVAQELGRKRGVSFCLFSYLEEEETRWAGWPNYYLRGQTPGPGTRLNIIWPDFEGYLAHLGKKQRYNIRRNCRLASDLGIRVCCSPTVTDVETALALHGNVNRHHDSRTEPWMRGAMEYAHMVDAAWLTAEIDGRVVGCELMLGDKGTWLVTGLGLDYAVELTYFVLGYADIRFAIERGARVLRWGSLTYEVKERLGFQKESNTHDIFAGRGLLQTLGNWMRDKFSAS
jgi:predicted N-acyltransferase